MSLNIKLVNMPFANIEKPAIGLTQLAARIRDVHGSKVSVDVNYLNHEFGKLIGPPAYKYIATHQSGLISGFGEWFFRQVAFPEQPDNREAYFQRFGPYFGPEGVQAFRTILQPLRARLPEILDSLIDRYGMDQADIVGFSSTFFQNVASMALAKRLRRIRPDQIIVMGGANCEGIMGAELIANATMIDYVFSGHSLVSFPEFVGRILAGDRAGCDHIDGVFSRENLQEPTEPDDARKGPAHLRRNSTVANMGTELDINTEVALDYDDFFASFDRLLPSRELQPDILFETSRGCWWGERAHCTFCGLNGGSMAYRAMAPDRAVSLIQGLAERYAHRTGSFECVDNILPREYVDGVFGKLRLPEHVSMFYEVKADLTEYQIAQLAAGGVRRIQPGIEALATSTLKLMRKGTTAFNNIRLLMHCKAHDVDPFWNLLVGFPGETAEVYAGYLEILPDLHHLPPPSGVFPVRFDRFSPYFTSADEYGLDLKPFDFYEFCYPFPERSLKRMAYYFQDTNYQAKYLDALAGSISNLREAIARWRAFWESGDAKRAPRLRLLVTPEGYVVEDTRSGRPKRLSITAKEHDLLRETVNPAEEPQIRAKFGDALDSVRHHRLIFTERGRVMNLVDLPEDNRAADAIMRERAAPALPASAAP
jgi:ribosomal peptide maturation radical SAM protein 1